MPHLHRKCEKRNEGSHEVGRCHISRPGDAMELGSDADTAGVLRMPVSHVPMISHGCAACQASGSACPVCAFSSKHVQSATAGVKAQRQPIGDSTRVLGGSLYNNQSIQAKPVVGEADDDYEKEADRVADSVMRMSQQEDEPDMQRKAKPSSVQRICESCEEELRQRPEDTEEMEGIQTKEKTCSQPGLAQLPDRIAAQIESLRGGGEALSSETRAYFEPMFKRDFSSVRVHANGNAPRLARTLNARAFTMNHDVVMGSGEYSPQTHEGRRLIAHELTHVVQQGAAAPKVAKSSVSNAATGQANVPSIIQRTTYPDCEAADKTVISNAVSQAQTELTAAITALNTRPLTNTVSDALYLAFRSDSVSTADTVRDHLQTMLSALPGAGFECEYPSHFMYENFCPTDRYGYARTRIGSWGNIHICTPTFVGMAANERSHGVIHESAHVYLQVRDRGYFVTSTCEETVATAGDPYTDRLNNADSYACIVNYLTRGVPADISRRADEYRGSNLALVQNPTGTIDLNSGTPRSPLFELRGIPANSGFVERWVIDDRGSRYLMWSDAGNPFRYGQYTEAYIPSRTRALLASRLASGSLTSPQVLCRVRLTREPHYRVSAPTVLLTLPVAFTT